MRAISVDYTARDLRERELAEPGKPGAGEVLFRVLEVGICGTDRDLAAFRFGYGPDTGEFLVLGHEAVGEVMSVGDGVEGLAAGDLIVPSVRRACAPPCLSCQRGRRDLCVTGKYTERGIMGAHGYFTELAVDRASDVVRVDSRLRDTAVLLEPLSVVEKAVALAFRLHQGAPRKALVLGAGTVGLLAACVLRLRGLEVDVVSTEPVDSGRSRLAAAAEARYLLAADGGADIVIEAAGARAAADAGMAALAPLGVLIVLGAFSTTGPVPFMDLIMGNRIVAGSVNSSPESFVQAALDLGRLPRELTSRLIERTGIGEYRRTLAGPPLHVPKVVHMMD
ncbi:MAG: alcohol dehydrogenase catalytic domain-containing protein [Bryobacteraceae bacterium]|nr:alcohol dehydrogenase catalytic domain-containing protein [Bryobacteraceae bacterium]